MAHCLDNPLKSYEKVFKYKIFNLSSWMKYIYYQIQCIFLIWFFFFYTFLQQISDDSKNGIITRYRIISQFNDTQSPPQFIENPFTTSHLVPVNNKYSTKILLNVATEVGFSTKSDSSLIVPPLGQGKLV